MTESAIRKVEQVASLRDRISESLSAAIISGELRLQTRMVNMARMTMSDELPGVRSRAPHVMLDRGDGAALEELTIKHPGHVIGWWAGNSEDR